MCEDQVRPIYFTKCIEAYFELYPHKRDEKIYLFFDEIQEIAYWEKFVRRIHDTLNANIVITGSSSKLLSKEIATSLRGRTISYEVFPLSFQEYLRFRQIDINLHSSKSLSHIKNALQIYVVKRGFPEIVLEEDEDIQSRILRDYVDLIVYRDIIERYKVKNLALLKLLIKYLFSNPATLVSFTKLYNDFKSMGYRLSKDTLFEYFAYLNDAYTCFTTSVFKSSVKEEQRNPKKVFIVDNGFNYIYDTTFSPDYSKLYENVVFLHLRRRFSQIYYYKSKREVDFYIPNRKMLVNVSYDVKDKKILEREVQSLIEGMRYIGSESGYLITKDEDKVIESQGYKIFLKPLWRWLLESEEK
ncbi:MULTISPECIES: ATP-binding protein [unclassified Nitratiruptor]|uniref:ATP-binding protein n=1 Tax=unclassified Nitratiruptor TaxID=2624044 RepID=UPI0019163D56|nr:MULTISPECIES: ATP-binding protein [unclassified Nitratiruptor]